MQVIRENKAASNSPLSIFLQRDMFCMCVENVRIILKKQKRFFTVISYTGNTTPTHWRVTGSLNYKN
jgi:hypothetical protein